MNDFIIEKSEQEIALTLYELSKDLDYMDYEDEKEQILSDIENALYYLHTIAKNDLNAEYFRTFYRILERIG